ncbi:hypothetical protein RvY_06549-1 [Ramazzottius varieornatus]|uniref:DUF4371 domain-containing protein n=1 Tax=Ramazzottius varieornatus TaxID=947166 RepID=A0A1D1V1W5_RAMVA|nr:hypothetical protein RvY_06549-1 [Ramazzottius varieornatus]
MAGMVQQKSSVYCRCGALGFTVGVPMTKKVEKALAEKNTERLTYHELDPQIRRGQGFDGAANMRGRIKRVRAEITKVQPKAIYTHCYAHSVNLVIGNAVQMGWIHKFYGEVNKIGKYFGTPKRRTYLLENFGCPRGTKVPSTICDTRWTPYADVSSAAFGSCSYLVDGLEALRSNGNLDLCGRNGAKAIREILLTNKFVFCLTFSQQYLPTLKELTGALQAKNLDYSRMLSSIETTLDYFAVLINTVNESNGAFANVAVTTSRLLSSLRNDTSHS